VSLILAAMLAAAVSGGADDVVLPGLRGVDPDAICFAAFAAAANREEKAGKPNDLLESAAGYFIGRLSARSRDSGADLLADMTAIDRVPATSLDPAKEACMKRYLATLTSVHEVMQRVAANAK